MAELMREKDPETGKVWRWIKCDCGSTVSAMNFTNTCDCGIDYNGSGQRLAPRGQWGEETGEHWSECY